MTDEPAALPAALLAASSALVADALDRLGRRDQVMDPAIRPIAPDVVVVGRAFSVRVTTTEVVSDTPYQGEMDALSAMRPGDVGVYSVPVGNRAAIWGELFSCGAIGRGAKGVVVDGCIRDGRQIEALGFPVFCTGSSPFDTLGRAEVVEFGAAVRCGGVDVRTDDVIVADRDGVVVVPQELIIAVSEAIETKQRLEQAAKDDLVGGRSIYEVWETYGVF